MGKYVNHSSRSFNIPKDAKVAIVFSEYYSDITHPMRDSAKKTLTENGVKEANILIYETYGAFELPYMAQKAIEIDKPDAVITLGCIVRGETPHFNFVAQGTTQGIIQVGVKHDLPVIFGVLTVDNMDQAKDRIKGGKVGDKGKESALAALKYLNH